MTEIMEIIGTIAFAHSGALVAISSGVDIFGVVFLAGITAFGGGAVSIPFINVADICNTNVGDKV